METLETLVESDEEDHTVVAVNTSTFLRAASELARSTSNREAVHTLLCSIRFEDNQKLLTPSFTTTKKRTSNEIEERTAEKTRVLQEENGKTPPKRRRLLQTQVFECDECETIYSTNSALKTHMDKEHISRSNANESETEKYQCALCPKKRAGIYKHYKAIHQIDYPEQIMLYDGNVLVHSTIDTKEGKASWFLKERRRAIERQTKVNCRLCEGEPILINPAILSDHYTMVHMVEPTMLNNIECMFRAEKGAHLNLTTSETPIKRKKHSNSTPIQNTPDTRNENKNDKWPCGKCDLTYSNKGNLARHVKKAHSVKNPEESIEALLKNKNKNEKYSSNVEHKSSSTSVKYKCALCEKTYTSTSIYKHYGNIHNIEYPEQLMFMGGRVLVLSDINTQDGKAPWFLKEKEKVTRYTVKTCRLCDTEFNSPAMLEKHYGMDHKVIPSAFHCLQHLFRAQKGAHLADLPASVKKTDHKNNYKVNVSKLGTEIKNQKPAREIEIPSKTDDVAFKSRTDDTVNVALQKLQKEEPRIRAQLENDQLIENRESNVVSVFCEICKRSINNTDYEAHAATHIHSYQDVVVNEEDHPTTENSSSLEPPVITDQGNEETIENLTDENESAFCEECKKIIHFEDLDAHAALHNSCNQGVTVNENAESDTSVEPLIRAQQENELITEYSEDDGEDAYCEECKKSINLTDLDAHADSHINSNQRVAVNENHNQTVESETSVEPPIRTQQENDKATANPKDDEDAYCDECDQSINLTDLKAHKDLHKIYNKCITVNKNVNLAIESVTFVEPPIRTQQGNDTIQNPEDDEDAYCAECDKSINLTDLDAHADLHKNSNQHVAVSENHNPAVESDISVGLRIETEQENQQSIENPEDNEDAYCAECDKSINLTDLDAHADLHKNSNQRVAVNENDNQAIESDTSVEPPIRTQQGSEQTIENPEDEDESAFCEECNELITFADLDAHAVLHIAQRVTVNENNNAKVENDTSLESLVRTKQGNKETKENPEDDAGSAFCEEGNKLMNLVDLDAHAEVYKNSKQCVAVNENNNLITGSDMSQRENCLSTAKQSENSENLRQNKPVEGTDTVESWNSDNDSCYSLRISTMTVKAQFHFANGNSDGQSESFTEINDADNTTDDTMEYENTEDVLKTIEMNDFSDELVNDLKRDLLNLGLSHTISDKMSIAPNKTTNTQELLEILEDDSSGAKNSKMNSGREYSVIEMNIMVADQDKKGNDARRDQCKQYNGVRDGQTKKSSNVRATQEQENDTTEKVKEQNYRHISQDIFTSVKNEIQIDKQISQDMFRSTQNKNLETSGAVSTDTKENTNAMNDFIDLTNDNDEDIEEERPPSASILTMVLPEDNVERNVALEGDGEEIDRQSLIDYTDRIRAIMSSRDIRD